MATAVIAPTTQADKKKGRGDKNISTLDTPPPGGVSTVSESDRKVWAEMLANSPREVARKYEAENKLPMQKIMKAYIDATEAAGYKWPVKAKLD